MTDFLAQLITWINVPANALGRWLFSPLTELGGWQSNTIISAITGVILLFIFKYTSNQKAIGRVRDSIKANLLALKLFKDSLLVTFQSQGRLFKSAFLLLFFAIKPMLVMMIPVCLLLGQLSLFYQHRPLRKGEEAVVIMQLKGRPESTWPQVSLDSSGGAEILLDRTRISSKRQIWWKIKAVGNGCHNLVFLVNGRELSKQLVVGDGFVRLSSKRPGWRWSDILMYPAEKPLAADTAVESISIDYPERSGNVAGSNGWLIYFFIASMVFAILFKPVLKVRI